MGRFEESAWAKEEFSRNYLERADVYIVDRRRMFGLAASFCKQFISKTEGIRLLDLGAGDGPLTHEILKASGSASATLVDGSEDMLYRARQRFGEYKDIRYVRASFQEILEGSVRLDSEFDLCVSSLAIHHLSAEEKAGLFNYIYGLLSEGGGFVNIDVVRPPSMKLQEWYFVLWRQWMREAQDRSGLGDEEPDEIIRRYLDPTSMNRPDTLQYQLNSLKNAGFSGVDCYYKNGIFAIFGGYKRNPIEHYVEHYDNRKSTTGKRTET